jgi:dihydroorotase/N-acyl-D-amino-acid deacylase
MSEPDVILALQQPWVSVDNDSSGASPEGILGQEHPHPRAYGTFPRVLRKYVREEKKLTLEDAIRKFSALPAQRMRLTDRGVLKAGMWADIVSSIRHSPRPGYVRKSQPVVAGDGVRAGEWHSSD